MILVPFCLCLFAFFFRQSMVYYQSNSISWMHMPKEILSQAFFFYAKFKISIDELFNFALLNSGLLVKNSTFVI